MEKTQRGLAIEESIRRDWQQRLLLSSTSAESGAELYNKYSVLFLYPLLTFFNSRQRTYLSLRYLTDCLESHSINALFTLCLRPL